MTAASRLSHKVLVEEAVERLRREGAQEILEGPKIEGVTVDLYAKIGGQRIIVECYTYFKKRILLRRLDVIRRNCDRFIVMVPKGQEVDVPGVEVWHSERETSRVFVAVHLDGELYRELEEASRDLRIPKTALICDAIREKIGRLKTEKKL